LLSAITEKFTVRIIAATAIELKATLVSNDETIFKLIDKIRSDFTWEDWTK
jgi:predicted nucleic acid-binding protein